MSAKQKRKTKPKASSEKATKTKTTRATRTKKKPGKEAPSAPVETKKPELKKPVESILVESKIQPEVKPSIEIKAAEKKPEAEVKPEPMKPEVKPEPKQPEVKPVEPKTVIVEAKREPEKPVEVRKEIEAKPELKPQPQPKPVVELKKPALARPKPLPKKKLEPPKESLLLIVRLRGTFAVPHHIERTLQSLRLGYKYNATLAKNSPSMIGMLRQVKDYVTWGGVKPIDVATLLKERGQVNGGTAVTNEFAKNAFAKDSIDSLATALATGEISLQSLWEKGVKPVFRFRPPSGGFKSTIKRSYTSTGQLGYRGSAIATLMTDMT